MASAWKRSPQTSQVTGTPRWSCCASTPTTSPCSTETFLDLPATRSPHASSRRVAACRSSCLRLPTVSTSRPKNSWREHGTRTQTRSPTPCALRCQDCANDSANRGSSRPCPASATASITEETVDRAPGLSVRLKLTLSYAAFLMLAGVVLLAAGYFSLSRGVHPGVIFIVQSHGDLLRYFAPIAAIVMTFLLVFGLLGGWLLAGRMLAPLTRITDATRVAAKGSLSHRIQLEGRSDEFRELADAFDTMLARLEAHVAEQRRFAANASHELRTPLAITQTLLEVA